MHHLSPHCFLSGEGKCSAHAYHYLPSVPGQASYRTLFIREKKTESSEETTAEWSMKVHCREKSKLNRISYSVYA